MGHCRLMEDHRRVRELLAAFVRGDEGPERLRAELEAHFAFEEQQLIPRLEEHLPSGTGPLPVLLEEHGAILGLLAELELDSGVEARRRLEPLLLSHFEKEEELILPFARTQLGPDDLARIGCRPDKGQPPECER